MVSMNQKKPVVLLIEDDEIDRESVSRVFQRISIPVQLYSVKNGIEALDVLFDEEGISLHPNLIIMDINMPKMNGIEFLKQLRTYKALDRTKILILTTSDNSKDKQVMSQLNVFEYLMKPIKLQDLIEICESL